MRKRLAKLGVRLTNAEAVRATMIADASSLDERLEMLAHAGRILWSGRRLKPTTPVARVRGRRTTVVDLISENRE